ncbi:hypothetical protein NL676_006672 [Syzygium grande]|nr:hypothetical protein NL676_006672 [Syzygium grande]
MYSRGFLVSSSLFSPLLKRIESLFWRAFFAVSPDRSIGQSVVADGVRDWQSKASHLAIKASRRRRVIKASAIKPSRRIAEALIARREGLITAIKPSRLAMQASASLAIKHSRLAIKASRRAIKASVIKPSRLAIEASRLAIEASLPMYYSGEWCSTQIIDRDGTFNVDGLENFLKEVILSKCGVSYAVVSILGPQSSGLKPPWGCGSLKLLIALFALAISDVVIINMWCHDIGRDQAASSPLLKTVFQVMMRLFSPRRTTLLFVIRDKTRLLRDILKIAREKMCRRYGTRFLSHKHTWKLLSVIFLMSSLLLSLIMKTGKSNLKRRRSKGVFPASGFSFSAQQMWKVIKEYKDLDLPAYEDWRFIEEASQSGPVPGFGKKLRYESEAVYFDKNVRSSERKQLAENLLQLVQPAFGSVLEHIGWETLDKFKEAFDKALIGQEVFSVAAHDCTQSYMAQFDKGCTDAVIEHAKWDTFRVRGELRHDMDAHVASVRAAKLSELTEAYKEKLNEALSGPVDALLDGANSETWSIVLLCMDEQSKEKLLAGITDHARGVVEAQARQESEKVLRRMRDRIVTLFSHDTDLMPRVWTGMEHIRATIKLARSASLRLLSVMAALRLDYGIDHIESTLSVTLLDPQSNATDKSITTIPSSETLITTFQLKSLWRQFNADIQYIVNQALAIEEAQRAEASRSAKNQWQSQRAILAFVVLGLNFMLMGVLVLCNWLSVHGSAGNASFPAASPLTISAHRKPLGSHSNRPLHFPAFMHEPPTKEPTLPPKFSPLGSADKMKTPPPRPLLTLPPPPPNEVTCTGPLTYPPPGTPCGCVWPIQVKLRLAVTLYTFFPLVIELAKEIAASLSLDHSQAETPPHNDAAPPPSRPILPLLSLAPAIRDAVIALAQATKLLIRLRNSNPSHPDDVAVAACYSAAAPLLPIIAVHYCSIPPSNPDTAFNVCPATSAVIDCNYKRIFLGDSTVTSY